MLPQPHRSEASKCLRFHRKLVYQCWCSLERDLLVINSWMPALMHPTPCSHSLSLLERAECIPEEDPCAPRYGDPRLWYGIAKREHALLGCSSRSLWVFKHVPCQHWAREVLLNRASESNQAKCPLQVELSAFEPCLHLLPPSALPGSACSTAHRRVHASRAHSAKQHGWVGHDAHVNLLCVGNVSLWVPQHLWGYFQGGCCERNMFFRCWPKLETKAAMSQRRATPGPGLGCEECLKLLAAWDLVGHFGSSCWALPFLKWQSYRALDWFSVASRRCFDRTGLYRAVSARWGEFRALEREMWRALFTQSTEQILSECDTSRCICGWEAILLGHAICWGSPIMCCILLYVHDWSCIYKILAWGLIVQISLGLPSHPRFFSNLAGLRTRLSSSIQFHCCLEDSLAFPMPK